MVSDLELGSFTDSFFNKARYVLSYYVIINMSHVYMPIKVYRSMMMTEFCIINTLFLSYVFTYPYALNGWLLMIYEIGVIVKIKLNDLIGDY